MDCIALPSHTRLLSGVTLTCLLLNHAVFRPTWPLLGGIVSTGRTDADPCNLMTYELANSQGGHFFQKSGQLDTDVHYSCSCGRLGRFYKRSPTLLRKATPRSARPTDASGVAIPGQEGAAPSQGYTKPASERRRARTLLRGAPAYPAPAA